MYKAIDQWLLSYVKDRPRRRQLAKFQGKRHLIFCLCDHFEPFHNTDETEARQRVKTWLENYPRCFDAFRDAGGNRPKHSFFYPLDQLDESCLKMLAELTRKGCGEVEFHLHHERDTVEHLKRTLEHGAAVLSQFGLLGRDESNQPRYGFIHGNWALDDSDPRGIFCGVSNELSILRDTGCYADFTMPSAPHPTQTRTINSIYYAIPTSQPKSHNYGTPAQLGVSPDPRSFLLVQGPLMLDWKRRKWGLLPRIERGDLTRINPPTLHRLKCWRQAAIGVAGKPDWCFIKVYTHGALPAHTQMFFDGTAAAFHREMLHWCAETGDELHYVSARELVNLVHAAEAGVEGSPEDFRNFRYTPPAIS